MRSWLDPQRLADAQAPDQPTDLARGIRALRAKRASGEEIASLAARLDSQLTAANTQAAAPASEVNIASAARWLLTVVMITAGAAYATVTIGGARQWWRATQTAGDPPKVNADSAASGGNGPEAVVLPAEPVAQTEAPAARAPEIARRAAAAKARRAAVGRGTGPVKVQPPSAAKPEAELALLRRAHDALAADPNQALALAEQHRAEYASGIFAQEREVIAIEALLALSRKPAAIARAKAFLDTYPASPHARRVRPLLERAESTTTSARTDHP